MKITESKLIVYITWLAFVLFFFADAINKYMIFNEFGFYRVSIFVRALFQLFFLVVIIIFINRFRASFLLGITALFVLFLLGQVLFIYSNNEIENHIRENIFIYNKYWYSIIIYLFLYKVRYDENMFGKIRNVFEWVLIANPLLAIIGLILKIPLLQTYYREGYRFGYSGLIPAQNEASIIFLIALLYFYYNYIYLRRRPLFLGIAVIASVILGTKAMYLSIALLLAFHFFNFVSLKKIFYSSLLIATVAIVTIKFLLSEKAKEILAYFIYFLQKDGWIHMILSGRNTFIETKFVSILSNWNIYNYLFGGQDQTLFLIEMDFFDLFLFFGFIGASLYLYMYFKTVFSFWKYSNFNLFVVVLFMSLAFLSGHFFTSAIIALYLCFFSISLHTSFNIEQNRV